MDVFVLSVCYFIFMIYLLQFLALVCFFCHVFFACVLLATGPSASSLLPASRLPLEHSFASALLSSSPLPLEHSFEFALGSSPLPLENSLLLLLPLQPWPLLSFLLLPLQLPLLLLSLQLLVFWERVAREHMTQNQNPHHELCKLACMEVEVVRLQVHAGPCQKHQALRNSSDYNIYNSFCMNLRVLGLEETEKE